MQTNFQQKNSKFYYYNNITKISHVLKLKKKSLKITYKIFIDIIIKLNESYLQHKIASSHMRIERSVVNYL